jgi:hypothetical protein
LKRLIVAGVALAVLVSAAAAYAAFNSYTGSNLKFSPSKAGSKAKPVAMGEVETLQANAPSGDRAAPLIDIKTTIYGVRFNGKKFPTCTDAQIEANPAEYDAACPKGSEIGSGPVHALLGASTTPASAGSTPCNTVLHIYNGGANKQVFFFTEPDPANCGGLRTGATAPYDGTISYHGNNAVVNVPLPPDVSSKVANQPGLYGSLISEVLTFPKHVLKGHAYMDSIACKGNKRPYSITFTAQDYSSSPTAAPTDETQTVKGNAPCSK